MTTIAGKDQAPGSSVVRLGRARLDGRPVALVEIASATYRLDDVRPGLPGVAAGYLDGVFADWTALGPAFESIDPGASGAVLVDAQSFLAPVERPMHLICIGTNYRDHIAEMGISTDPVFPYAFLKPLTTIAAPSGPVTLSRVSGMIDWEAELGVVIGRRARHVPSEHALDHVAGYLPLNDVSARDWIDERPSLGIDWIMQKASDGFTPLGPWITLAGGVADPQAIPVQCRINGDLVQDSSTANMLFPVAEVISHLSRFMTLSPGDVIATGTPAGVGFGRKPRRFINPGDIVTVSLGELGSFATRFKADDVEELAA